MWTYTEMCHRVLGVAEHLRSEKGTPRCIMRLDNVADNIVAQLACAHAGVGILTVKTPEALGEACAAVTGSGASVHVVGRAGDLAAVGLDDGKGGAAEGTKILHVLSAPGSESAGGPRTRAEEGAFYNSARGTPWAAVVGQGALYATHLGLGPRDGLCLGAVTLAHPFGFAGAMAALGAGARLVLPRRGPGGGAPTPEATLACLTGEDEQCTALLADTHTLKALEALGGSGGAAPGLRCGLVKVGSGEDLALAPPVRWAGVDFTAVGKPSK